MLGQQRQQLTQLGCIITDPDRCQHHTRLVDHGHIVMILGSVDTACHRYHRRLLPVFLAARRDALMDSANRTTSHEPFAPQPAALTLAHGFKPATDQGSARWR
jgi:hypothetical protein